MQDKSADKKRKDNVVSGQSQAEPVIEKPMTDDSATGDLTDCLETIDRLKQEKDEYLESLLRKQAEFENYRKRVNREIEDLRGAAQADVFAELLPVIDSCEKGLENLPDVADDSRLSAFREGLELILSGLLGVLSRFEVSEVSGEGSAFDPLIHEAVLSVPAAEGEHGRILEEFRKGYRIGNRLIRPSQVKVAVETEEAPNA